MAQVQLDDHLYEQVQRRAADAAFSTVDEYVAEILSRDFHDETDNLDHLFTPERLAHIDKAEAQIKSGNFYTSEQADVELAKRRAEWLRRPHPMRTDGQFLDDNRLPKPL